MEDEKVAMAVNGEVFDEPIAEFWQFGNNCKSNAICCPGNEDLQMPFALDSTSGQYNYGRCKKRNDIVAANLALDEFMREGMRTAYLLNRKYMPLL